ASLGQADMPTNGTKTKGPRKYRTTAFVRRDSGESMGQITDHPGNQKITEKNISLIFNVLISDNLI
ncbi:MAG: hypothetical protein J0626_09430, partial [Rhodospirillaceae bacterium]|nr:hypothetical protein [Rhodospirillaceae bacterium]